MALLVSQTMDDGKKSMLNFGHISIARYLDDFMFAEHEKNTYIPLTTASDKAEKLLRQHLPSCLSINDAFPTIFSPIVIILPHNPNERNFSVFSTDEIILENTVNLLDIENNNNNNNDFRYVEENDNPDTNHTLQDIYHFNLASMHLPIGGSSKSILQECMKTLKGRTIRLPDKRKQMILWKLVISQAALLATNKILEFEIVRVGEELVNQYDSTISDVLFDDKIDRDLSFENSLLVLENVNLTLLSTHLSIFTNPVIEFCQNNASHICYNSIANSSCRLLLFEATISESIINHDTVPIKTRIPSTLSSTTDEGKSAFDKDYHISDTIYENALEMEIQPLLLNNISQKLQELKQSIIEVMKPLKHSKPNFFLDSNKLEAISTNLIEMDKFNGILNSEGLVVLQDTGIRRASSLNISTSFICSQLGLKLKGVIGENTGNVCGWVNIYISKVNLLIDDDSKTISNIQEITHLSEFDTLNPSINIRNISNIISEKKRSRVSFENPVNQTESTNIASSGQQLCNESVFPSNDATSNDPAKNIVVTENSGSVREAMSNVNKRTKTTPLVTTNSKCNDTASNIPNLPIILREIKGDSLLDFMKLRGQSRVDTNDKSAVMTNSYVAKPLINETLVQLLVNKIGVDSVESQVNGYCTCVCILCSDNDMIEELSNGILKMIQIQASFINSTYPTILDKMDNNRMFIDEQVSDIAITLKSKNIDSENNELKEILKCLCALKVLVRFRQFLIRYSIIVAIKFAVSALENPTWSHCSRHLLLPLKNHIDSIIQSNTFANNHPKHKAYIHVLTSMYQSTGCCGRVIILLSKEAQIQVEKELRQFDSSLPFKVNIINDTLSNINNVNSERLNDIFQTGKLIDSTIVMILQDSQLDHLLTMTIDDTNIKIILSEINAFIFYDIQEVNISQSGESILTMLNSNTNLQRHLIYFDSLLNRESFRANPGNVSDIFSIKTEIDLVNANVNASKECPIEEMTPIDKNIVVVESDFGNNSNVDNYEIEEISHIESLIIFVGDRFIQHLSIINSLTSYNILCCERTLTDIDILLDNETVIQYYKMNSNGLPHSPSLDLNAAASLSNEQIEFNGISSIFIIFEELNNENESDEYRSNLDSFKTNIFLQLFNTNIDITVLQSYSLDNTCDIIRNISTLVGQKAVKWGNYDNWANRKWCLAEETIHEHVLISIPGINNFVAQWILSFYTLSQFLSTNPKAYKVEVARILSKQGLVALNGLYETATQDNPIASLGNINMRYPSKAAPYIQSQMSTEGEMLDNIPRGGSYRMHFKRVKADAQTKICFVSKTSKKS